MCTGNCNQGRACTCVPECEPLTFSEGFAAVALVLTGIVVWAGLIGYVVASL